MLVCMQLFDTDNVLNKQAINYIFTTEGHVIRLDPANRVRPWDQTTPAHSHSSHPGGKVGGALLRTTNDSTFIERSVSPLAPSPLPHPCHTPTTQVALKWSLFSLSVHFWQTAVVLACRCLGNSWEASRHRWDCTVSKIPEHKHQFFDTEMLFFVHCEMINSQSVMWTPSRPRLLLLDG